MPRKQEKKPGCTSHKIYLCEENREMVYIMKAKIERRRKAQSNVSEAINEIIDEWRMAKQQAA